MEEYIIRLVKRDPEHPLAEKMVFELGVEAGNKNGMIEITATIAELFKLFKTPEKVSRAMQQNLDFSINLHRR